MRHYDVTDSQQMSANKTFACWYRKFRNVVQLHKPSSTHYDDGGFTKLYYFYNFFRISVFHNLFQRARRLVLN